LEERIYLLDNWYVKANNIMADENISLLEKGNAIGYGLGGTCVIKSEYLSSVDVLCDNTVDTV
jgi:hypothetical protein